MKDLVGIFANGFNTLKDNPIICIPFLINLAAIAILGFIVAFATLISIIMPIMSYAQEMSGISPEILMEMTMPLIAENGGKILIGFLFFVILATVVRAFFVAGAIGMAKEASENGVTIISDMLDYGRKKFVDLFLADVITGVIIFMGFLFLIPGILSVGPQNIGGMYDMNGMSDVANTGVSPLLLALGILLMLLYMLIFSVMLSLVRYAVILDDLGPIDGVKKGFDLFWENKGDVFLLWLVLFGIYLVIYVVSGISPVLVILGTILSLVLVRALSTVWWTHLYMERVGIEKSTE